MALKYTFTNNDFYNKKKINNILIKSNFNDDTFKVSSNVLNQEVDYNKSLSVNSDLTSDELSKYVSADTIVEYEDGHRETITVDNNSSEFKNLCNYLKM